ncbi:hypothetical protein SAMN03097694_0300 [Janthinobacterium lividum]|uniref:Uncharacterized protein n=1 Tax=Janthinobacterium lividum TaxID=29581 RepID=A0AB38CHG7_9BURK|nr:DUF6216 family protein [Janthinobacterium lividum]SFY33459.1 hypothetical protein SAMN03097694_0300 [Janthinobacterium lividum]
MESFTNFIGTIELKNYAGIFYFLIIFLFLFGLVWLRTKSTHTLMSRLWRISHGKSECTDTEIKKILDNRSALMQFRFTTGIPIRLQSQIQPLIQWANKNREDIDDISRCGIFFDLEKPGLKERTIIEKALTILFLPALCFSLFIMLTFSTATALTDKALIKIKESENWILINNETAKRVEYFYLVTHDVVKKNDCENFDDKKNISLTKNDVKLICKVIKEKNEEDIDFIAQTVKEQKIFFPVFSIFFLIPTVLTAMLILKFLRSLTMEGRLRKLVTRPTEDFSI